MDLLTLMVRVNRISSTDGGFKGLKAEWVRCRKLMDGHGTAFRRAMPGVFDTAIPGNHTTGHVYGTDLNEDDRWALVEYQKTL